MARVLPKSFFRVKMAAAGVLFMLTREKRKYEERTLLEGMRRSEVIQRYRLSPERIEWLVNKFENELRRNTNRNFPVSPETQVIDFLIPANS